jgi:hypothetical protein
MKDSLPVKIKVLGYLERLHCDGVLFSALREYLPPWWFRRFRFYMMDITFSMSSSVALTTKSETH